MLDLDAQNIVQIAGVGLFTVIALATDLRVRKIPNVLTVPAFLLGLVYQCWFGGWSGLWTGLGGFAIGFGTLLVLWLVGGGGAGDVKMMGALGAWIGARWMLYVLIISTFLVAMGTVAFLMIEWVLRGWAAMRRRYLSGFAEPNGRSGEADRETAIRKWRDRRRIMPYALPVGLATWMILAYQVWRQSNL